ncbi:TolC family protein [Citrobacter sp. JGM124]|uniref:TolC family protein n=1 Tax=Citrobacter sp. JGM124 TaxID=2799789 RepID=UPI001BAD7E33|nr:TolC family protein [Citrobacter sp. JGM124]MBS0849433.1 TolC family protein [Citrobacter sp. JGM124]
MKTSMVRMDKKIVTKMLLVTTITSLLSACVTDSIKRAPASPSTPWQPSGAGKTTVVDSFAVPTNLQVLDGQLAPKIEQGRAYTLPELINIAQLENPDTRIAWQQARQAALAVGLTETLFLPMISASVVGGYQHTRTPLSSNILDKSDLETNTSAVIPALVLQWLVFDFGQRRALLHAAEHASFAANIGFNGIHQKIIYDVTRTYYQYGAAQSRYRITKEMLDNSKRILAAAEAKRQQGIGTSLEVAQATQLVAQAELNRVVARGAERDARQALLASTGLPATSQLGVDAQEYKASSLHVVAPTQKVIEQALSRRPDVLASYALAQAAKEGITAAEADYFPKIVLAGGLADAHSRFDIQGMPSIGPQTSASNILLAVSVPIYDGGMRAVRVQEAQSRATAAHDTFEKTREVAAREIVVSSDVLESAIASNTAAVHLVKTALITYDAAFDAYQHGVGTITVVNEAANNLLLAQQMEIDARTAVLVAAANLAFVMGEMTQAPR